MKMTMEVPAAALSALRRSPEEFARELRVAAACKWYEAGQLSQERAAELAGLSRNGFLHALASFHVSPFQESGDDLVRAAQW